MSSFFVMIRAIAVLSVLSLASGFQLNMLFNFGAKKSATPAKKQAAPTKKAPSSSFAGGLVGQAVENPFLALPVDFDPFQLSVGKSDETLAWYRAAELKVSILTFIPYNFSVFNDFILSIEYVNT